ncbi:hypothetical protein BDR04DRAFT_1158352 [Suillus decipiens]|nr:hypothetical protein BDR04DRAFT_1158352 [Suillus decipiens]
MSHQKCATSVSSSSSSDGSSSSGSAVAIPPKKISKKVTRPKKRQCSSDDDEKGMNMESETDPHEKFLAASHCLALQQRDAAENGELSEDEDAQVCCDKRLSKISPRVQERYKKNFTSSELNTIIKKMDAAISATCSDDTSHLKSQIGHYMAFNTKDHPICPAIYDRSGLWTHLGINHPILAHFLCPVRELKRFSEDADKALKDIQCGNVNLTAFALPAFLWARDLPGKDYDDDNMFKGMFDDYAAHFYKPFKCIWGETHATCTCNAALHNMTMVEAVHITYGCLQVCFGISAKNAWSEVDGAFNYRDFYNNIIELIDDSPDPEWKEELIKVWNVKLFKNEEGHDSNGTQDDNRVSSSRKDRDNDLARVHVQMAACHAAKAALAHPPSPPPSVSPPPHPRKSMPAHPSEPTPYHKSTPVPPPTPRPVPAPRQVSPRKLPAPSAPAPACAESPTPSDLTRAELDEESESVQVKCKHTAKKGSTKVSKPKCGKAASADAKPQRSSRK